MKRKEDTLVIIELKQDGNSGLCFMGFDCYLASSSFCCIAKKHSLVVYSVSVNLRADQIFAAVIRIFPILNDKRMGKNSK